MRLRRQAQETFSRGPLFGGTSGDYPFVSMIASTKRYLVGVVALAAIGWVPLGLAPACGGAKTPDPATSPAASATASGAVPLFTQSSGASPIHLAWKVAGCEVEMRDGLGGTYRFEVAEGERVQQALRAATDACVGPKGMQGTVYIEAKVSGQGALTGVVVSPGGAVSTDTVQCLAKSFGDARVASPKEADSVLLVFMVSACPVP